MRLDLKDCNFDSLLPLCSLPLRLRSLYISEMSVQDASSWSHLFAWLSDNAQPTVQSLRQFHLGFRRTFHQRNDVDVENDIHRGCLAMLNKNQRLTQCVVADSEGRENLGGWVKSYAADHNKPLPEQECPLPVAETCAFLGVVTPVMPPPVQLNKRQVRNMKKVKRWRRQLAQHRLDRYVIRLVLEFAAIPKQRVCMLLKKPNVFSYITPVALPDAAATAEERSELTG